MVVLGDGLGLGLVDAVLLTDGLGLADLVGLAEVVGLPDFEGLGEALADVVGDFVGDGLELAGLLGLDDLLGVVDLLGVTDSLGLADVLEVAERLGFGEVLAELITPPLAAAAPFENAAFSTALFGGLAHALRTAVEAAGSDAKASLHMPVAMNMKHVTIPTAAGRKSLAIICGTRPAPRFP